MIAFHFYDESFWKKYHDEILEFEQLHSNQIRWSVKEKEDFFEIEGGRVLWMTIFNQLTGEILWNVDTTSTKSKKIAYIWSNSIVEYQQNKGYGTLMKQVLYNSLRNMGYHEIKGHAKEGSSWNISKKMGAKLIKKIKNYGETGETYYYYKQKL